MRHLHYIYSHIFYISILHLKLYYSAELNNLYLHQRKVVSRYCDPQLQAGEHYLIFSI